MIINEVGIQVLEEYRTTDNCYGVVPTPNISCRSARVDVLEFGIKDLAMQTLNKWQKCPNLKPLWGSQNLERWRRPFVAPVKWGNKQS